MIEYIGGCITASSSRKEISTSDKLFYISKDDIFAIFHRGYSEGYYGDRNLDDAFLIYWEEFENNIKDRSISNE